MSHLSGGASLWRVVSTLYVITASRGHAAFAPKRPHGITPAANSFFNASFTGAKDTYEMVFGTGGNTGWRQMGTWTP